MMGAGTMPLECGQRRGRVAVCQRDQHCLVLVDSMPTDLRIRQAQRLRRFSQQPQSLDFLKHQPQRQQTAAVYAAAEVEACQFPIGCMLPLAIAAAVLVGASVLMECAETTQWHPDRSRDRRRRHR